MKTLNKLTISICMLISLIFIFGTRTSSAGVGTVTGILQYSFFTPNNVTVTLYNNTSPYSLVATVTNATMNAAGVITANFPPATPAGNYYVAINGWNILETWSSAPVAVLLGGGFTYNFSTLQTQAYGSNLTFVNPDWTIYQGDVNQDGVIDLADLIRVYNDAKAFVIGSVETDIDGNLAVNLTDIIDCYNNAVNFVNTKKP